MKQSAEIAVIGGTGFYGLFEKASEHIAETPYGPPSGIPTIGNVGDRGVAFLPRHGYRHELPPHVIPYRANIWSLHMLGVKRIIAPCAVGSLSPEVKPGDFVLCDQFVNFTRERKDTFYDGPKTTHISAADPYCPVLRKIALEEAQPLGLTVHPSGTVIVIQGPRFSTRAESKFFRSIGGSVINMTQYPEAVLARELEMCYLNISLITDYDVGLEGDANIKPVTHEEVLKVFNANTEKLKKLMVKIIAKVPQNRTCLCSKALEGTPWR